MRRKPRVLLEEKKIKKRVEELGREISRSFSSQEIVVISLLKGAFIFTADLVRVLEVETEIDFMRVKSYRGGRKGKLEISLYPEIDVSGREVLIVDDIFDTGESLEVACKEIASRGATLVRSCVLLDKDVKKQTDIRPDFVGFKIPDYFVVGYGLDLDETFRGLPYIGYFEGAENG